MGVGLQLVVVRWCHNEKNWQCSKTLSSVWPHWQTGNKTIFSVANHNGVGMTCGRGICTLWFSYDAVL